MANFKQIGTAKRASKGFDETVDERQFVNRKGISTMFEEITDCNGVTMATNAHDERGYEDMRRLPEQTCYRTIKDETGAYLGTQEYKTDPPMSSRVRSQVFNSIGARVGTMTSDSLLDRSRGEGQRGADGGLEDRSTSYPNPPTVVTAAKSSRYKAR
jgi:hypothetical protein